MTTYFPTCTPTRRDVPGPGSDTTGCVVLTFASYRPNEPPCLLDVAIPVSVAEEFHARLGALLGAGGCKGKEAPTEIPLTSEARGLIEDVVKAYASESMGLVARYCRNRLRAKGYSDEQIRREVEAARAASNGHKED